MPLATAGALAQHQPRQLYYRPAPPSAREVAIKHRIDEMFTAYPFYGSRKLQVLLEPEFGPIARNTVRRYMHEMGIAAIYPGPNLSKRHTEHRIYPYLLRRRDGSLSQSRLGGGHHLRAFARELDVSGRDLWTGFRAMW